MPLFNIRTWRQWLEVLKRVDQRSIPLLIRPYWLCKNSINYTTGYDEIGIDLKVFREKGTWENILVWRKFYNEQLYK
jgi:hypothetical protein